MFAVVQVCIYYFPCFWDKTLSRNTTEEPACFIAWANGAYMVEKTGRQRGTTVRGAWIGGSSHVLSESEAETDRSRAFYRHWGLPFRENLLPASLYLANDPHTPQRATPVLDQVLKQPVEAFPSHLIRDPSNNGLPIGFHPHPNPCLRWLYEVIKHLDSSVLLTHQLEVPASSTAARAVYHHVDAPAWGKGSAGK